MHKGKFKAAALVLALTLIMPLGTVLAANGAPVAENLELTTYRNVCVGGQLSAVDPEGDAMTFEITTSPARARWSSRTTGASSTRRIPTARAAITSATAPWMKQAPGARRPRSS